MSFKGPIDNPRLFVLGVGVIPLVGSYATTVLVRWIASRQGFAIDVSKYSFSGIVLSLYVIMASLEGVLLEITGGIPPGIGPWRMLAVLVTISAIPIALGLLLFNIYLLSDLDIDGTANSTDWSVFSTVNQEGVLLVLVGSSVSFFGTFMISLPSFFVFSIIIS